MIQTVTGTIRPEALGRTLMHEHILVGFPGWEAAVADPSVTTDEMLSVCVDRIEEIRGQGVTALVDPCPSDLGRDVEFAAKLSQRTGFQIVCATGLYKEESGGSPYWRFLARFGSAVNAMAELFIKEIQEGIGETSIRAGIIKVGTGAPPVSKYEKWVLEAAAKASVETGAPITTHTDEGRLGDEQQAILTKNGVPPERIIIGHSCGTSNHDYHTKILRGGSYLGFDRFGIERLQPDAERVSSLLRLLEKGFGRQIVVSHDTVWCWRGATRQARAFYEKVAPTWNPTHFFKVIVPRLKDGGATDEQIETLLVDNPRRFFAEAPLGG